MVTVNLSKEHALEVSCQAGIFYIYEGDDGTLYVEAAGDHELAIVVSDYDETSVDCRGQWINVTLADSDVPLLEA